jgi:hypothetical protein
LIIDADGLFNGDRLRKCSKMARLYYVHLMGCANSCGRMEINYRRLAPRAFANFAPDEVPNEPELLSYVREYAQNRLLFLYTSGGQLWGQWDYKPGTFGKYQSNRDKKTPEPPKEDFEKWQLDHTEWKDSDAKPCFFNLSQLPDVPTLNQRIGDRRKIAANSPQISPESAQNSAESGRNFPSGIGVGIGVGVGVGKKEKQNTARAASDVRFDRVKKFVKKCCEFKHVPFVWDVSEGKQLKSFLDSAGRDMSVEAVCSLVRNRFNSREPPGDRPRIWLSNLGRYATVSNGKQQTYADKNERSVIDAVNASIAGDTGLDQEGNRHDGDHVRAANDRKTIDAVRRGAPRIQGVSTANGIQPPKT